MVEFSEVLLYSSLPYPLVKRGKVKDVYDLGDNKLLMVFTDRISAFDVVLPSGIPHKGEVLNKLSLFWFDKVRRIVKNHVLEVVDGRTVVVKKTKPIKVEFIVRGYLYGSAWENYKQGKPISGIFLPPGLRKAEVLPEPILTPTTKSDVGHDVEMSWEEVLKVVEKDLAEQIKEACLKIYEIGSKRAEERGIIIADTKIEFGLYEDELMVIDELLTPDSSRFWPKDSYEVGKDQVSLDKQYVRDYLNSIKWDKKPPAPTLPEEVVAETSRRYIEIYERITGERFFK
ncbi:MAG: phosphoribosylaminoimidazolesuccinocarboxamide synthase [Candidatus Methanomethylicota archaeon]|uniref:Phosphoribosylaminoimidazole-succinocarboxamide synthase n=1 Tax=Thermoproteota archaeon TaxID=2056631 RepID=A0A497ERL2_9CREN|nr:MAG: phosphoribosylaminoimidazolesuccinocarboxamide synthase [Candidatus Verstraetearchaeota archaeon]